MLLYRMTYHILADGTVAVCDFDHQLLQKRTALWYLGIMYQEKCDLYEPGNLAVYPRVPPPERSLPTSHPYNTSAGPFPQPVPHHAGALDAARLSARPAD